MEIQPRAPETVELDAVIVGAGIGGMYAVLRLRELGLSCRGVEAGSDVGGTWYWNRYPGCRCDIPSLEYSLGWDTELEQEWHWSEMNATQGEIERYLQHVADRFDLRPAFVFDTRVTQAVYDEDRARWTIHTDRGDHYTAKYCVMATGGLSAPNLPAIPGVEQFAGTVVHTGMWPQDGVDLAGRRVGVVGTGSSGMQAIPQIAAVAEQLTVFQRTPNYAFPGAAAPMDPELENYVKANYRELRERQRHSIIGVSFMSRPTEDGGEQAIGAGSLTDLTAFSDAEFNRGAREYFATMVRERVLDPAIADDLIPTDYPMGCKRLVVEIGYFETFNRPNVRLVNLRKTPIDEITESGVRVGGDEIPLDVLVFATGFDALTGALSRIEIRGRDGLTLAEKWKDGPKAYLGILSAGFPNMFTITGPGSPSVLTNVIVSIEQHVEWMVEAIRRLEEKGVRAIDADAAAEEAWMSTVADAAVGTQFVDASCSSFYLGTNIEGKPRVFLPYVGGIERYGEIIDEIAEDGYRGFILTP